MTSNINCFK